MTSLDTYIEMIGETIIDYCNKQIHSSGKHQPTLSVLKIKVEKDLDADKVLTKIDDLNKYLFNFIIDSLKTGNPQRQFHLLYFLDKYIFFKKALVCASYTEIGWKELESQLKAFITNCYQLRSNTIVQVSVPIHQDIILKGKAPKKSDDGQQYIVDLTGLNSLSGPSKGWTSGDLGRMVTKHLIKPEEPGQVVKTLIFDHRKQLQFPKISENVKRIRTLEQENQALREKHAALEAKVDAQAERLDKMQSIIEAIDGKQKTITIMSGPSFFSKPEKPELIVKTPVREEAQENAPP